jgi:glycolate oxidase FAD binding subunit
MTDAIEALRERIERAFANQEQLQIVGGASKTFLGRTPVGEPIHVDECQGIVSYEPTELVITARAGTRLDELDRTVRDAGQLLAFEPPHFGPDATLGGTVACGLSGPRRPYAGAVRDFVLGVKIINGKGELLRFGGQVMKNVAGYDVSRLMTGAMGCLGVLVEVSLKVLPRPASERTLAFEMDVDAGLTKMLALAASTTPLSGACFTQGHLHVRLSGTQAGVAAAARQLGGEHTDAALWADVRELTHVALNGTKPLWRISVPATTPNNRDLAADLIDWGGALRWVRTDAPASTVRQWAEASGGHARVFSDGDRDNSAFHPLKPAVLAIHQRLKKAFDPNAVLNPHRMYAQF